MAQRESWSGSWIPVMLKYEVGGLSPLFPPEASAPRPALCLASGLALSVATRPPGSLGPRMPREMLFFPDCPLLSVTDRPSARPPARLPHPVSPPLPAQQRPGPRPLYRRQVHEGPGRVRGARLRKLRERAFTICDPRSHFLWTGSSRAPASLTACAPPPRLFSPASDPLLPS